MCNFEITISKGNLLNKVEEYKVLTKSEIQKTIASGDDGVEETLLPIPNRTVKLYSVNGTAWVTVWESRTLPGKASSLILDAFFYCMPSMGNNLTVKVLLWDWQWEPLAKDKGVHCEVESEGSRRQSLGLRNTNYIQGLLKSDEFAIQNKVQHYPKLQE